MLPDPPKIVTATGARARAPTEGGGVRVWWWGGREGCRMDRMGWMILGGWAFLSCRRRDHRTRRHRMAAAPRRPPSHRATAVNRMTARAIFSSIFESLPLRTRWREGSAGPYARVEPPGAEGRTAVPGREPRYHPGTVPPASTSWTHPQRGDRSRLQPEQYHQMVRPRRGWSYVATGLAAVTRRAGTNGGARSI